MTERLKVPVLKTGEGESLPWVRIPPHPPFHLLSYCLSYIFFYFKLRLFRMSSIYVDNEIFFLKHFLIFISLLSIVDFEKPIIVIFFFNSTRTSLIKNCQLILSDLIRIAAKQSAILSFIMYSKLFCFGGFFSKSPV